MRAVRTYCTEWKKRFYAKLIAYRLISMVETDIRQSRKKHVSVFNGHTCCNICEFLFNVSRKYESLQSLLLSM